MKKFALLFALALCGCVTTLSSYYSVSAYDDQGNQLNNKTDIMAHGHEIDTARDALCQTYPNAVIIIKDMRLGKHLEGESPSRCPS